MIPPSFSISAMAMSIIDEGVLSGYDTTTGLCAGGTAITAVNKASKKAIGRRILAHGWCVWQIWWLFDGSVILQWELRRCKESGEVSRKLLAMLVNL
jgi:hypothetical protein